MLLNLINSNKVTALFLFIILFCLSKYTLIIDAVLLKNVIAKPFGIVELGRTTLPLLMNLGLLVLSTFYFNYIVNKHKLIEEHSGWLPATVFALITSLSIQWNQSISSIFVLFCLLILIERFLSFLEEERQNQLFQIGVITGIGTLFHFGAIIFLPIILLRLLFTTQLNMKLTLSAIIGFIVPWIWWIFIVYIGFDSIIIAKFNSIPFQYSDWTTITDWVWLFLSIITTLFLYFSLRNHFSLKNQRILSLMFWLTIVLIIFNLLLFGQNPTPFLIISIPLSVFLCFAFDRWKNTVLGNFLFLILVVFIAISQLL